MARTDTRFEFEAADGTIINMSSENIYVTHYSGLGAPSVIDRTKQVSNRPGKAHVYTSADARQINLTVWVISYGINNEAAAVQQKLLERLTSKMLLTDGSNAARLGKLRITRYDETTVEIDCGVVGGLDGQDITTEAAFIYQLNISFSAAYPMFRAIRPTVREFPITYGDDSPKDGDTETTVGYEKPFAACYIDVDGSASSENYEITINGPSVKPLIWNRSSGFNNVARFDGVVRAGEALTVRGRTHPEAGGNDYYKLASGADWSHELLPGGFLPTLIEGTNEIIVMQDNIHDDLQNVTISWYNEYLTSGLV